MLNPVSRVMRIAIVLADLRGGGAERVAVNLANGFLASGYAVDVVTLSAGGPLVSELDPGVRVVNLGVTRLRWVFLPLVRYFRSARPSAVLGVMWPLTALLVLGRAFSGVNFRLVLSEHCTWSQSELLPRPLMRWRIGLSMRLAFPRADGLVCVSRGAADDLARFGWVDRGRISVIYNPVVKAHVEPTAIAAPIEPKDWCVGNHRRVLAVGSLKEIKDYFTLLRAFGTLRQGLDVKLLILGEGQCRSALQAESVKLGIQDSVFMPGFAIDPEPYFAHADLHVLSSTSEGLGNVIIEALAAGTPVVSTDCPHGPREILEDGKYGRLVPVGDVRSLCEAMAASLDSTQDRSSLIRRSQDFSIGAAVDQYLQLLVGPSRAEAIT
jgi:glycosyltransferase involved in cell wall biosynthesis